MRKSIDAHEPTQQDREKASEAANLLSEGKLEIAQLPGIAVDLLGQVLEGIASGNALYVVPVEKDMTTNQAADYLNVSRPYLIGLLDQGKIAYHQTGSHKRVYFQDLKKYKEEQKERSYALLAELQAEAQELGMGH